MTRLYSNLKFLRYPDRLKALADDIPAAPIHVRVKPINHCNHNCWYCAYRADQLQLGEDMDVRDRLPEAKMSELIDDLIEMGVAAVTFSGGGE
ncbi:MAG: radical SAM protein, partial [Rhodospirillaceae bacterium]